MTKRDKMRMLKVIVWFCMIFPALFGVAGLIVCWHIGADPTGIVQEVVRVYIVELGLSCLLKLTENKEKKHDNDSE